MSTDKKNRTASHLMIWNELKWVPSEKQLAQFIHLQELLKEWNKKTNLTRLVDGDDFWTGPLDPATGSNSPSECEEWDQHFKINRSDVEEFLAFME